MLGEERGVDGSAAQYAKGFCHTGDEVTSQKAKKRDLTLIN